MVTVVRENGDVHFLNDSEFIEIQFFKDLKQVEAHPVQRTASVGRLIPLTIITDVLSITYTNERQATGLSFATRDPKPIE